MTRLPSLLAALALAGCAAMPRPQVTISAPFDEAAAAEQMQDGDGSVKGSALVRQQGGGVVTCAGFPVGIFPANPYSKARMTAIYGSERGGITRTPKEQSPQFTPDPPAYTALLRETRCDAQGFFRFDKLRDGDFYVIVPVIWKVGHSMQGGMLSTMVTVKRGETKEVVLAH